VVDPAARGARVLDRSRYDRIHGVAWSPDARWLAYGFQDTEKTSIIRLCEVATGAIADVTRPVLADVRPSFDPDGKYLYFLSHREFNPVYDSLHFDLGFPQGMRPYLVTLRADLPSPFAPPPFESAPEPPKPEESKAAEGGAAEEKPAEPPLLRIDLEGIADRVIAFPVPAGLYSQIGGIKGKALFASRPAESSLAPPIQTGTPPPGKHKIEAYDFAERSRDTLVEGVDSFGLSRDGKMLIYRSGNRLRALKAGEKPKEDGAPGRKSGWLDLGRARVSVDPAAEWEQMYREAWRLQRDQFWTEDMSGIDWRVVYERYLPLLERVGTRGELSDLLWEMQGELGTSHAYEIGGDYPAEPRYDVGLLAADLRYDEPTDSYAIERIAAGDVWSDTGSPLARPGIGIRPGDRLLAVNGRRVGRDTSPGALLVHQAGAEVLLTVAGADGSTRTVVVTTLRDETPARYREWVEGNRRRVHAATGGRVGYVHIPDMMSRGYAEFHRGYLAEVAREALIVDVRYNGGGHVSQLVLEKLARRRLGYSVQRWGAPSPYPNDSVMGPIVAITNEQAGSDGDIFSHVFKLMRLGPLIGKRTWGGVIGINPRDMLADGAVTTQPEYSFWFNDVGWQVENYGTDPDIEVDIRPQDYVAGDDPQLDRALAEVERLLAENPPQLPDFSARPRLGLPTLPDV
jgi:tricorn protease